MPPLSQSTFSSLQYTFEKIGKADNLTTYDTEFETLSQQLESIRISTEKIISHVQSLVQPHPGQYPTLHTTHSCIYVHSVARGEGKVEYIY